MNTTKDTSQGKTFLSELVHYRSYAKYLPSELRRETREETINRSIQMHVDKFPKHTDEIVKAFKMMQENKVVCSMRSMQFAGDAMTKRNNRGYNCSATAIQSFRDFADLFFMSMSGAGVGFSVKKRHIYSLPKVTGGFEAPIMVLDDSAEGWCDSLIALLNNPSQQFDYSNIRKMGEPLSTGGTASGPKALIHMHANVRTILRKAEGRQLTSFECHRVCCLIADCVVVGGVRRGALISVFDYDDTEMLHCKSGNWHEKYPELQRANNSASIMKNDPDFKEKAGFVIQACFDGGQAEPGLSLTNDEDYIWNPCQPSWAKVLTKNGIRQFKDISIGDEIWSKSGWTKVINKWSTGVKKVYEYKTTAGVFYGTQNHRVVSYGEKVEAQRADSIDVITGEYTSHSSIDPQDVMDGIVFGDGSVHKASNNLVHLLIGDDDGDYFTSEVSHLIGRERNGINEKAFEIITTIEPEEIPKTFKRSVPDRFYYGNKNKVIGFLRGLYTANGSICGERVTLKSASELVIQQVQAMISSIGILSYFTTNKPTVVNFSNGQYECKKSYDLNITIDRYKFLHIIGFIQSYKCAKLQFIVDKHCSKSSFDKYKKTTYEIIETNLISEEEVFDITVDNDSHTYWTQCCNVSNCHEISLKIKGLCNLSEVNAARCFSKEEWLKAVEAATIIGTLQASYTDFKYVHPDWQKNAEEEALLGVSITGQAENQAILTESNLMAGAQHAVEINRIWAAKLGINPAKRVTTCKPSGSASSWLGTTAGIHAGHEIKYMRRVRIEAESKLAKSLQRRFGAFVVQDPFRDSDIIMQVPVKLYDTTLLRNQETAVQCLDRMKKLYHNWIAPGHIEGPNTHNISMTINYHEHEKEAIKEWMINNKESYYGISLIPYDGGDYQYLPYSQPIHSEVFEVLEKSFADYAKDFDFSNIKEVQDNTNFEGEISCQGGSCSLE